MLSRYELFQKLAGDWHFTRSMKNVVEPGLSGTVTGTATFSYNSADRLSLHYRETGIFSTATANVPIHKEYIFRFDSLNNQIDKYYLQNNKEIFMYSLGDTLTGEYICNNDLYKASYEFNADSFSMNYVVTGREKNYRTKTLYVPF